MLLALYCHLKFSFLFASAFDVRLCYVSAEPTYGMISALLWLIMISCARSHAHLHTIVLLHQAFVYIAQK